MSEITTIGLDLAKSVFQVHGVDEAGNVVVRKLLRRSQVLAFFADLPRCLVGMEACATAHHWARELITLDHDVRLMPLQYVKAYVRRNKNDAADEPSCPTCGDRMIIIEIFEPGTEPTCHHQRAPPEHRIPPS